MDFVYYELKKVVNYSRRLSWEKDRKESNNNLIHMLICGAP